MRAYLVRVGADSTHGGFNAPVDPDTLEFAYVPIPEDGQKSVRPGHERTYGPFGVACRRLGVDLPTGSYRRLAHLDPDFEQLTYGDEKRRGRPLLTLGRGDLLAFYAGLKPTRHIEPPLMYALIGMMVIDIVAPAKNVARSDWDRNAHTRRVSDDTDIVVFGQPSLSGRLERCIPIGELRDGAYRVTNDLLDDWGDISVHDGWIQRSGTLPAFLNPDVFYRWFQRQAVKLVRRNN